MMSAIDVISNWIAGNRRKETFEQVYASFLRGDHRTMGVIREVDRRAPIKSFEKFLGRHITRSAERRARIPQDVIAALYDRYCRHFLRADSWRFAPEFDIEIRDEALGTTTRGRQLSVRIDRAVLVQDADGLNLHFDLDDVGLVAVLVPRKIGGDEEFDASFSVKAAPIFRQIYEKGRLSLDVNDIRFLQDYDLTPARRKTFLDKESETEKFGEIVGPQSYTDRMRAVCFEIYAETSEDDDSSRQVVKNLLKMSDLVSSARSIVGLSDEGVLSRMWRETQIRSSVQQHLGRMARPLMRMTEIAEIYYGKPVDFLRDENRSIALKRLNQAVEKYPGLLCKDNEHWTNAVPIYRLDREIAQAFVAGESVDDVLRRARTDRWFQNEQATTRNIISRGYFRCLQASRPGYRAGAFDPDYWYEIGQLDGVYAPQTPRQSDSLRSIYGLGFNLVASVKQFKKLPRFSGRLEGMFRDAQDAARAFRDLISASNAALGKNSINVGALSAANIFRLLLAKGDLLPLQVLRLSADWHRHILAIGAAVRSHSVDDVASAYLTWPVYLENRDLAVGKRNVSLRWLSNLGEIREQGIKARNCVGGYASAAMMPLGQASHLATIDDESGAPIATVEFAERHDDGKIAIDIRQIQFSTDRVRISSSFRKTIGDQMKAVGEDLRKAISQDLIHRPVRASLQETYARYASFEQSRRSLSSIVAELEIWKRFSPGLRQVETIDDLYNLAKSIPQPTNYGGRTVFAEIYGSEPPRAAVNTLLKTAPG